jgi:hypothetical protein
MLLGIASERQFLRFAIIRLGHLFPYLPKQPGYNKRLRALAPQIVKLLNAVAFASPSWYDRLRLLDSTPIPCGASRQTLKRSEFAGHAAYGYCASHSRYFWGFRLYLLCASDGMPIAFELAPPTPPSATSPPKCSPASSSMATRCSPTRASPAKSSKRCCANSALKDAKVASAVTPAAPPARTRANPATTAGTAPARGQNVNALGHGDGVSSGSPPRVGTVSAKNAVRG